jgi:4-hydroxythreonine-4-phosphate dehydrogenase
VGQHKLLAITTGDPAGIGPEVSLKAIRNRDYSQCSLILFGDADVFHRLSRASGLPLPKVAQFLPSAIKLSRTYGAAILHIEALYDPWTPGEASPPTGHAAYQYIAKAIDAAVTGLVDGVVTGPIHKEALRQAGISFPGHTEIFEQLTNSKRSCMMLTSTALTCTFVTTHVGLEQVPRMLSIERILDVIELTNDAMQSMLGRSPHITVCGLNPHAGENGLFGDREEEKFICPAIELARQRGIDLHGPLPPDTAFLAARREKTDAYVCMYHDQGHIPLKALSFETAVNVTLGLPIVRTSVDHGTALDIAWRAFDADATSMQRAIGLAEKLCESRSFVSTQQNADMPNAPRRKVTFL